MVTPERITEIREEGELIPQQLGYLAEKLDTLAQESKIDCEEDPRGAGQENSAQDPLFDTLSLCTRQSNGQEYLPHVACA